MDSSFRAKTVLSLYHYRGMRYLSTTVIVLSVLLGGFSLPTFAQSGAEGLPSWAEPSARHVPRSAPDRAYGRTPSEPLHAQQPTDGASRNATKPWAERPDNPFGGPQTDAPRKCARNPDAPGCRSSCGNNPTARNCSAGCETNPGASWCNDSCSIDPNQSFCNGTTAVPVDDWLPLLALAGLGLGVYRIRQRDDEMISNVGLQA